MNYQAFTNDSLTMMYAGIRGALDADDALKELGEETRFRVRRPPIGESTRPISKPKCSSGECFSRSSIGTRGRARCPLRPRRLAWVSTSL
jgi:hypothetical protein